LLAAIAAIAAFSACDDSKPSPAPPTGIPSTTPVATASPPPPDLSSQLRDRADLKEADFIDLAARYGRTDGRVAATKPFAGEADVGDSRPFTVTLLTGGAIAQTTPPQITEITATLRAKSAHAYFYVDNALAADTADVESAAAAFESDVWSRVTEIFGTPRTPGIDGDPRIIVLHADLGGAVGGYHSSDDVYPREVRPASNEAEMVYLDRSLAAGSASFTYVLAHELQHLIHSNNDESEEAWVNEGLSETAWRLVAGYVSSLSAFEAQPQTQLNHWQSQGSLPHYGAGAAFFRYLADRFGGDDQLGAIAREAGDGADGVEGYLSGVAKPLTFRDVFSDWIVANALNRSAGPYGNPTQPVDLRIDESIASGSRVDGEATQFGTDYYIVDAPPGAHVLRFSGDDRVDVLPEAPGDGFLWSNTGDSIDTAYTSTQVDLTGVDDAALTFRTWFDIERWYDWGYVAASTDGGTTWQALAGEHTSSDDPVRIAMGAGYTGKSGGGPAWLDERIDLSRFAGQRLLLRFEYVTDGATHGEGWIVDDVNLDGVATQPQWSSNGWVEVDADLPQTYAVRVFGEGAGGEPVVLDVSLDDTGRGELRFETTGLTDVVIAIAGTTEGTIQRAPYTIELDP
jgi:hypothetical protein